MKRFGLIMCLFCSIIFLDNLCAYAGSWDQCKGCHDGALAPNETTLKQKYKTADDLVKAAKKVDDPLMDRYKKNEELLRKAAEDIGLK
jgi:hypothetical protein